MRFATLIGRRSLTLLVVTSALAATAAFTVYEAERRAIVSIRVAGDLRYTPRAQLEQVVAAHATSSLYRVDVGTIRNAALTQAWVKHASVRRVWPDSLHIAVIEREPVARWGDTGLLEADGSVFYPPDVEAFSELPLLGGPTGSEQVVLARYNEVNQLLATVSRKATRLSLDLRHAWVMQLDNGVEVLMGQSEGDAALRRLVQVFYVVLRAEPSELARVDLRYTNGFAVLWKTQPQALPGEEQG